MNWSYVHAVYATAMYVVESFFPSYILKHVACTLVA